MARLGFLFQRFVLSYSPGATLLLVCLCAELGHLCALADQLQLDPDLTLRVLGTYRVGWCVNKLAPTVLLLPNMYWLPCILQTWCKAQAGTVARQQVEKCSAFGSYFTMVSSAQTAYCLYQCKPRCMHSAGLCQQQHS